MADASIGEDIRPRSGSNSTGDGTSGNRGTPVVNPSDIDARAGDRGSGSAGSGSGDGDGPKRRGRKPGSRNRTTKTQVPVDLSSLAGIIVAGHALLASATSNPELALSDSDGKVFAESIGNVLRHYDVAATQKTIDHAALLMTAAGIYGPRLVIIGMRKRAEREAAKEPPKPPASFGVIHGGTIPTA